MPVIIFGIFFYKKLIWCAMKNKKQIIEQQKFEIIWKKFYKLCYYFCEIIISSYHMQSYREELISAFFERILNLTHKNLDFYQQFMNEKLPVAFLKRIFINIIYDKFRKINSENNFKVYYDVLIDNIIDNKINLSEINETEKILNDIKHNICTKIEKEILEARFTYNLSVTNIAKNYNVSRSAMSKRISKICEKLKIAINKNIVGSIQDNLTIK